VNNKPHRTHYENANGFEFRGLTVYDPAADVFYVPFVAEDGRVGYRVGGTGKRADVETFIYFNPSTTEGDSTPNVFVYEGVENDPGLDNPLVFVTPDALLDAREDA
jgi:hypothetical protein